MPLEVPPAGSDGLPSISGRAFQLVDQGYTVWEAVYYAVYGYLNALVAYYGELLAVTLNRIG